MSIACRVQTHGAGAEAANTIVGDGAIDTRDEAVAALALMPNADDVIIVGTGATATRFTKTQLETIRDAGTTPPPPGGTTVPDPGADIPTFEGSREHPIRSSSAIEISGRGVIGLGDNGHNGGSVEAAYVSELPTHLNARLELGALVRGGSVSRDYELPGGGDANSRFNAVGVGGLIGGRFPYAWQNRIFAGARAILTLSGVWTPDSTMGTVAGGGGQVCYDSGAGRQQCEERAGSQTNLGTTGGYVPDVGNSRGQSGLGLGLDLRLTPFGVRFPVGDGNIDAFINVDLGVNGLFTGAGSQWLPHVAPGAGARWVF